MSKIGKAPISIPDGIDVQVENGCVKAKKSGGKESRQEFDPTFVTVESKEGQIFVKRKGDAKRYRERHGLYRSLIASTIEGLSKPFKKELRIEGLGYRARTQGNKLILELGFSHPIEYEIPEGIEVEVEDKVNLTVKGSNKQKVGQVAADIRSFRPPEPYKGKGVRYKGERIIRKEGKLAGGEEAGLGGAG